MCAHKHDKSMAQPTTDHHKHSMSTRSTSSHSDPSFQGSTGTGSMSISSADERECHRVPRPPRFIVVATTADDDDGDNDDDGNKSSSLITHARQTTNCRDFTRYLGACYASREVSPFISHFLSPNFVGHFLRAYKLQASFL